MKALGTILGVGMLAKGAMLAFTPRGFVGFWSGEQVPPCLRNQAKAWQEVPEWTMRQLGVGLMIVSAVMLGLAFEKD